MIHWKLHLLACIQTGCCFVTHRHRCCSGRKKHIKSVEKDMSDGIKTPLNGLSIFFYWFSLVFSFFDYFFRRFYINHLSWSMSLSPHTHDIYKAFIKGLLLQVEDSKLKLTVWMGGWETHSRPFGLHKFEHSLKFDLQGVVRMDSLLIDETVNADESDNSLNLINCKPAVFQTWLVQS